ncbi:MAG: hypothetical protein IJF38_03110 [Clostridia bacterium]|nr:hypothetical protein [Clostridia bacterium]
MKKYVIGWTHFDNEKIEGADCTHSDNAAIIDDIRAHGYSFSGYAHQELDGGVPVMNDGKARRFSRRIWGSTMANAHGKRHPYDYTLWAEALESEEAELRGMPSPDRRISDAPPRVSPETLYETYRFETDERTLQLALKYYKYNLDNTSELRYIDIGDTVILTVDNRDTAFTVTDVERKWRLAPEGKPPCILSGLEMRFAMRSEDEAERKLALEKYMSAPDVLSLMLRVKG